MKTELQAPRTIRLPELVDGRVVIHEYVLHESPQRPGSGIAKFRRSLFG